MADKTPKWDDTIAEPTFEETTEIVAEPTEEEKMSALEAARVGLTEGATFGLDTPLAGISAAAGELVGRPDLSEQELSIQQNLEKAITERRNKMGKEVGEIPQLDKGDYESKLLDTYYEGKKGHQALQEKAAEDQKLAYYGSMMAGGMTGLGGATKLANAASKMGKGGKALSKVLPTISKTKDLSRKARIGKAAIEGGKAGGIVGTAQGDAKLLEGEIGETAKEIAGSTLGGAALGAGTQALGETIKGTGKLIGESQLAQEMGETFKRGLEGVSMRTRDAFTREVGKARNVAKNIRSKVVNMRKQTGSDMGKIREAQKSGIQLSESVDRFVQKLDNVKHTTKAIVKDKTKIFNYINQIDDDLTNMDAKEAGKVVNHIKSLTDLVEGKSPIKDKELQAMVREFSKEATESVKNQVKDTDFIRLNKLYSKLSNLEKAGKFKEKFDPVKIEEEVDRFVNLITRAENPAKAQASFMQLDRFLTRLKDVDIKTYKEVAPKINEIQKSIEIVRKTIDLPEFSEALTPGLIGRGRALGLKVANIAGESVGSTKQSSKELLAGSKKFLTKSTPEDLHTIASKIQEGGSEAAKRYIRPLMQAAEGTDAKKNAAMYGLYQQPAFRQVLKDIGYNLLDEEEEK